MAEDGRIYDRESIETHFENHPRGLKSPITGKKMGRKLQPAIQHRNTIDTLVKMGVITGDLATSWNEKKEKADLLNQAEGGNEEAMWRVGLSYSQGDGGFRQDDKLAFWWYEQSHKAGCVKATASLGEAYLEGDGVAQCNQMGMMYISLAAAQGSNLAASYLGDAFAGGLHGTREDEDEAVRWLEVAVGDCPFDHLSDEGKEEAQKKLDELNEGSRGHPQDYWFGQLHLRS